MYDQQIQTVGILSSGIGCILDGDLYKSVLLLKKEKKGDGKGLG